MSAYVRHTCAEPEVNVKLSIVRIQAKIDMKFRVLLVVTLAAATTACLAQSVKYEKYVLPNGMKVILHEDHSVPVAAVNIWYHVGSKDEPARRTGFAHLFEHLMFMGTERVPGGQFDKLMEADGGGNNASTWNDRTN